VAALLAVALLSACQRKVTRSDCHRMIEHYLDMVVGADPSFAKLPPEQKEAIREMKRAVRMAEPSVSQVQTRCEAEVSRKEYDCTENAKNPDEWQACIE
jgi:hypothetical protein